MEQKACYLNGEKGSVQLEWSNVAVMALMYEPVLPEEWGEGSKGNTRGHLWESKSKSIVSELQAWGKANGVSRGTATGSEALQEVLEVQVRHGMEELKLTSGNPEMVEINCTHGW